MYLKLGKLRGFCQLDQGPALRCDLGKQVCFTA